MFVIMKYPGVSLDINNTFSEFDICTPIVFNVKLKSSLSMRTVAAFSLNKTLYVS